MPALLDPRHEAFAQARARGALLIDAYESAGFVRHRGHPSRLACKAEVADRIAELRALQTDLEETSPTGLLASLRRIIKAGEASDNPTLVNAARLAIVDASRLHSELARRQAEENWYIDNAFKNLQKEEAADQASKAATQRPSPPRQAPAAAPSAPRERPSIAPGAPAKLLASAAASPLKLPGLSTGPGTVVYGDLRSASALRPPPSPPPPPRPPAGH